MTINDSLGCPVLGSGDFGVGTMGEKRCLGRGEKGNFAGLAGAAGVSGVVAGVVAFLLDNRRIIFFSIVLQIAGAQQ